MSRVVVAPAGEQLELLPTKTLNPTPTRRGKYSDLLLPHYQHLGLSEAVVIVVQQNAEGILTPERVTRKLFIKLSVAVLTQAQAQVGKMASIWSKAMTFVTSTRAVCTTNLRFESS